jgi:hypothetical protein
MRGRLHWPGLPRLPRMQSAGLPGRTENRLCASNRSFRLIVAGAPARHVLPELLFGDGVNADVPALAAPLSATAEVPWRLDSADGGQIASQYTPRQAVAGTAGGSVTSLPAGASPAMLPLGFVGQLQRGQGAGHCTPGTQPIRPSECGRARPQGRQSLASPFAGHRPPDCGIGMRSTVGANRQLPAPPGGLPARW